MVKARTRPESWKALLLRLLWELILLLWELILVLWEVIRMPYTAYTWNRCCFCGRFISWADFDEGRVGWWAPASAYDYEPPEEKPYHKACK